MSPLNQPATQKNAPATAGPVLTAENLRFLCQAIYQDSGIVLDESKTYLLEARLLPLARKAGTATLDGLCGLLRATGGQQIRQQVVEAMTTNETLFFRDIKPFEALEKVLMPQLLQDKNALRRLRFWSAACSSGQEPYSLAMLFLEMGLRDWEIDILGTELSETMLARAQAGRYSQLEVNRGLPAKYLVKYFARRDMEWEIKSEVRRMVRWQKFNLKDDMTSLGRFDVVFCRNVLIYFDVETKRRMLRGIREVLAPGGYLVLGASETTLNVDEIFVRETIGPAIMYRNPER